MSIETDPRFKSLPAWVREAFINQSQANLRLREKSKEPAYTFSVWEQAMDTATPSRPVLLNVYTDQTRAMNAANELAYDYGKGTPTAARYSVAEFSHSHHGVKGFDVWEWYSGNIEQSPPVSVRRFFVRRHAEPVHVDSEGNPS